MTIKNPPSRSLLLLIAGDRRGFVLGLLLGVVGGFVELAGVAGLYPFLAVLSQPELAHTNRWLLLLRSLLGISDDRLFLIAFGALCLAVFLAASLFLFLRQAYITRYALRQTARLATQLLRSYLRKPYAFFLDQHSAEISKNVIGQSDAVANGVLLSWMVAFSEFFVLVALAGLILWMDPWAGLATVVVLGALVATIHLTLRRRLHDLGQRLDQTNGRRFTYCLEALQAIKEIKAANAEEFFETQFTQPASEFAAVYARTNMFQLLPSFLIQASAVTAIIGLALGLLAAGRSPAEILPILSLYAMAGYRLMPSLSRLTSSLAQVRQSRAVFDNVTSVLEEPAPPQPSASAFRLKKSLLVRDAVFSYPGRAGGRRVLDCLSLELQRGSFVALAGASGAGKTTIADVLLGLLELDAGEIILDGTPLSAADMPTWRRSVGYIPQSLFLSDSSISANVAFGVPQDKIDPGRVREALRLARLDEFIDSIPGGVNASIGERGARLSGGQRQRLGIARALYHDPDLLILDESTSALDGATEAEILTSLRGLTGQKTILAIAHRPATLRNADAIVLLQNGGVADVGTYQDLIVRSPQFANLMAHAKTAQSPEIRTTPD